MLPFGKFCDQVLELPEGHTYVSSLQTFPICFQSVISTLFVSRNGASTASR